MTMHIRGFERFDNRAIPGDCRLTNIRGVAAMRDRRRYVYLIGSRANQLGRRQESLCIVGVAFAPGKHSDGFFGRYFAQLKLALEQIDHSRICRH